MMKTSKKGTSSEVFSDWFAKKMKIFKRKIGLDLYLIFTNLYEAYSELTKLHTHQRTEQ